MKIETEQTLTKLVYLFVVINAQRESQWMLNALKRYSKVSKTSVQCVNNL